MPKRSDKFFTLMPKSMVAPKRRFTISNEDWRRIENAYAQQLSDVVRRAIVEETQKFVDWEIVERKAKPIADGKKQIEAWRKAARDFRGRLETSSSTAVAMSVLIQRNFRTGLRISGDPFSLLDQILIDFDGGCERALSKLSPPPTIPTLKEGEVWQWWIRSLGKIMEENSLPTRVRKDSDKSDKRSPFTRFVWELQFCLPPECERHTHSTGGLADAIIEARKKRRAKKIGGVKASRHA